MKDILTVFRFTLRDGARKKAFWVTTIIVLVLIVGICCVPRVMDLVFRRECVGAGIRNTRHFRGRAGRKNRNLLPDR